MPLHFKAGSGSKEFQSLPAGSHILICNLVAYMGLQPGSKMYPDPKHKLYIRWEAPEELMSDGRPYVIGKKFTASMHEKANLRILLEGWRGKRFSDAEAEQFDVSTILGKAGMGNVVENEAGYMNLAAMSPLPKGVSAGKARNELVCYMEDDRSQFDSLPEWLQKEIESQLLKKAPPKVETDQFITDAESEFADSMHITDEDIPF